MTTVSKTYPLKSGDVCCAQLDGNFSKIFVKERIDADGGEGRVFRCEDQLGCTYALKIYENEYIAPRAIQLLDKIDYMNKVKDHFIFSVDPIFAWPIAPVFRGSTNADLTAKNFLGFIMPLGTNLTTLYDLIERARVHNSPTLSQRLAICLYLARGFARLHAGYHIQADAGTKHVRFYVGDANDLNFRVATTNYMPFFLDCDSYICEVDGVRFSQWTRSIDYCSPESLSDSADADYKWSQPDDNFALSVLIFRFLNDWHLPYLYDGYLGKRRKDVIRERRFPFSTKSSDKVIPAANTAFEDYRLSIDESLQQLFDAAFLPGGAKPTAVNLMDGLKRSLLNRPDVGKLRDHRRRIQDPPAAVPDVSPSRDTPLVDTKAPLRRLFWLIVAALIIAIVLILENYH